MQNRFAGALRCGPAIGRLIIAAIAVTSLMFSTLALAQPSGDTVAAEPVGRTSEFLNLREMLAAGGAIGYLIVVMSFIMVALVIDHILNIRRVTLMPPGLAEEVHRCLSDRKLDEAKKLCDQNPSYLGKVLRAGLEGAAVSASSVEKTMEDASVEQSARLFRRIEYLSVISALAPMLGLMGTVWGMILAFLEFEQKANPQVSDLAPGIYRALITTLLGLGVAIPALAAFSVFRIRIDELGAEATLLAEHVFADFRRVSGARRASSPERSAHESPPGPRPERKQLPGNI